MAKYDSVSVSIHWRGVIAFVAFVTLLAMSLDSRLGVLAVAAWLAIEALLWSGVFGFGRGDRSEPEPRAR